jgi:hypothetical protein
MGNINVKYIPPAILHLNPGINRESLVEEFNKIHIGSIDLKSGWNKFDWRDESPVFHGGLFELAEILSLERTIRWTYDSQLQSTIPWNSYQPKLIIQHKNANGRWLNPVYQVATVSPIFGKWVEVRIPCTKPVVGKGMVYEGEDYIVRDVKNLKKLEGKNHYEGTLRLQKLEKRVSASTHFSVKELVKFYPKLNPETTINWSQERGTLDIPLVDSTSIGWRQRNGRFYLNYDSLNETDYTSMIITSEAIKQGAWNLFGFYGYNYTNLFLIDNPQAYQAHYEAVLAFQSRKLAVSRGLKENEWLRRLLELEFLKKANPLDEESIREIMTNEGSQMHGYFEEYLHSYYSACNPRRNIGIQLDYPPQNPAQRWIFADLRRTTSLAETIKTQPHLF